MPKVAKIADAAVGGRIGNGCKVEGFVEEFIPPAASPKEYRAIGRNADRGQPHDKARTSVNSCLYGAKFSRLGRYGRVLQHRLPVKGQKDAEFLFGPIAAPFAISLPATLVHT